MIRLELSEFEKTIAQASSLSVIYEDRAEHYPGLPKTFVPASVLILFGYSEKNQKNPSILYIQRTEKVETHKGQMAFPGGRSELGEENMPELTALRETHEEVGLSPEFIQVAGQLPALVTVTGYEIRPIIGLLKVPLEKVTLTLCDHEIDEAIWISLDTLILEGTYRLESISVGAKNYPIHVYQVDKYRIWGATASITKNLLDRLLVLG